MMQISTFYESVKDGIAKKHGADRSQMQNSNVEDEYRRGAAGITLAPWEGQAPPLWGGTMNNEICLSPGE
jgi:hypothetical protein